MIICGLLSIKGIPLIVETVYDSNKYFGGHIILHNGVCILYNYMFFIFIPRNFSENTSTVHSARENSVA